MLKSKEGRNQMQRKKMKVNFISPLMEKIAHQLGVEIHIEPKYKYVGQIVLPNGTKRYFRSTRFDLNTLGATEIARDKSYASYFMHLMGYPVPEGQEFFTNHWAEVIRNKRNPLAAYDYAKKLGLPVIVKPNTKSQGSGVAKVYNKREFMQAVNQCKDNVFLVQRVAVGNDYRIVVLDDRVISAYQRFPLSVTGDGRNSILKLLLKKQQEFNRQDRDTIIPIDDIRIKRSLKRLGLTMDSVPQKKEGVELLANANLSTGGDAIDVTKRLHLAWKKLAIQLTRDMGLRYCGVDVMVQGTLIEPPQSFVVIEINAAPGIDNYASMGEEQRQIVEEMYTDVFKAMLQNNAFPN